MNFFVNNIFSATAKANKATLSFVDVKDIPQDLMFQIFVPKSVELKVGEVNNLPHWITKNIWTNEWVWKDLVKQIKKTVHKRTEKIEAVIRLDEARKALKERDVEEPIQEIGEFIGKAGDTIYGPFKVMKYLFNGTSTYSGIWQQKEGFNGLCHWTHPSVEWVLWELTDMEGHCIILKCSNDDMNGLIGKMFDQGCFFQMKATIGGHNIFRGVRQTKIRVRKQEIVPIENEN